MRAAPANGLEGTLKHREVSGSACRTVHLGRTAVLLRTSCHNGNSTIRHGRLQCRKVLSSRELLSCVHCPENLTHTVVYYEQYVVQLYREQAEISFVARLTVRV